jgi:GNAT superfamily N-acetyltransferase
VRAISAAIRHATSSDVDAVLRAYEWLFAAPGSTPPNWDPERARERLAGAVDATGAAVLVADDDQEIVGICSAYLDIESVRFGLRCWVEDLAVNPARRSEGIGAALLAEACAWARECGASHLELDSGLARTDAHRFYDREGGEKMGFSYGWEL